MSGPSRYWSVARGVAWRNVHNYVHNPALLVPSLVFPTFFYTAFAGGLSAVSNVPNFNYPDYNAFQFVFVVFQSAAFGGVFTGLAIARDYEGGFARRLMLAAPQRTAVIAGYVIAGTVRTLTVMTLLFAVALATGMDVSGGGVDVVVLVAVALVFNVASTLFAAGMSLRFRTLQVGAALQIPIFLFTMLAPVYAPRHLLTGWVHEVANYNPATALMEAGRGLIAGLPADVALAFSAAGGLVIVFAIWAYTGLRRAEAEAA